MFVMRLTFASLMAIIAGFASPFARGIPSMQGSIVQSLFTITVDQSLSCCRFRRALVELLLSGICCWVCTSAHCDLRYLVLLFRAMVICWRQLCSTFGLSCAFDFRARLNFANYRYCYRWMSLACIVLHLL